MSYSHTKEIIDFTITKHLEVFEQLKNIIETGDIEKAIEGTPIQPLFRKVSNFNTKPRQ